MKVLFLLRYSIWSRMGGSELQAEYLSRELVKRGYEVHQAFDASGNIRFPDDGIIRQTLPDHNTPFCWLNAPAVKRIIQETAPSLIYQRVRCAYTGIAAHYARKYNIKMVYHVSTDRNCRKNKIAWDRRFVLNAINEYLGRYGVKKAHRVMVQTHAQKKSLWENFKKDSVVIPNGHFPPSSPFEKESPPLVLWLANIKARKRPEFFVELARRLQDTSARFVLAGRPEAPPYQDRLLEKIDQVPNLTYLEEIPFEETNRLLSKASLLVNTSLQEGFPNSYIQAWMRETPVVTLQFDPDAVIEEKSLGFHSRTLEKMEQQVRELLRDEDKRRHMGKNARDYALKHHDIHQTAAKFIQEISKVSKDSSKGGSKGDGPSQL